MAAGNRHWENFVITSDTASSVPSDGIVLEQIGNSKFRLRSRVTFNGATPTSLSRLWGDNQLGFRFHRRVPQADRTAAVEALSYVDSSLGDTDLASIPGPFQWWISTYGAHTPAALVHDRFIGGMDRAAVEENLSAQGMDLSSQRAKKLLDEADLITKAKVTEANIDTYFRHMLKHSGVPWLQRWLLWSAVAVRTRLSPTKRPDWATAMNFGLQTSRVLGLIVWLVATGSFVFNLARAWELRSWEPVGWALISLVGACIPWGFQFGAGLTMTTIGIPLLLVPAIAVFPFIVLYRFIETNLIALTSRWMALVRWRDSEPTSLAELWQRTLAKARAINEDKLSLLIHREPTAPFEKPKILSRYNASRAAIATIGGVTAAIGITLSFDHAGDLLASPVEAITWPPSVNMMALVFGAIGLALVFAPRATRFLRFLLLAAVAGAFLWRFDSQIETKLVMGLAGACVTLMITNTIRAAIESFRGPIVAKAAAVFLAIAGPLVLVDMPAAEAQATSTAVCSRDDLLVVVDGRPFDPGGEPVVINIDQEAQDIEIEASTTTVGRGTVVIELMSSTPIPLFGEGPVVVWSGDFEATGEGASTGVQPVRVSRDTRRSRYFVTIEAHDQREPLAATLGRYRAVVHSADLAQSCEVFFDLRITAPPLSTTHGRVTTAVALLGLSTLGAALLADPLPRPGTNEPTSVVGPPPGMGPEISVPSGEPDIDLSDQAVKCRERLSDDESVKASLQPLPGAKQYELTLGVSVDEKEHDPSTQLTNLRFGEMIRLSAWGEFSNVARDIGVTFDIKPDASDTKVRILTADATSGTGWTKSIDVFFDPGGPISIQVGDISIESPEVSM